MDAFSQFLELLRLRGQLFGQLEFTAPWGFTFPGGKGTCIVVNRGSCFLSVNEEHKSLVPLVGGDFVFLPAPRSYSLRNSPETPLRSVLEIITPEAFWQSRLIRHDGGGTPTSLIAGCFTFATAAGDWLRNDLPPIMHVRASDLHATPAFQSALQLIAAETAHDHPGSTAIVDRLAEVLFVQAMRLRIHTPSTHGKPSWFQALTDPRLGAALRLMHTEPSRPWTVPELARRVSMSRSAFAARFRKLVGETPLDHLTRWRMVYAAGLMADQPALKLAAIASTVGYETESAFGKVFRRVMGSSPAAYRKSLSHEEAADIYQEEAKDED